MSCVRVCKESCVALFEGEARYAADPPYSPAIAYPEYPLSHLDDRDGSGNPAYSAVREALRLAGLDEARFDTLAWNPFGDFISPGQTVVIKPNFVREFRESQPTHGDCLITHGSVIRAVLDYALIALDGRGRLIVADAPQNDADFDAIRRIVGLHQIRALYRRECGFELEIYDLRPEAVRKHDGIIVGHVRLPGDPAGYVRVNLGRASMFTEVDHLNHLLYGSEYDVDEVRDHHHGNVQEYLISRTVLDADVVISVPKLKTHKKVGLTVNLKNLVGINGNKNWLPHHREGTPAQGGDQYRDGRVKNRIERRTVAQFKRVFPWMGPLRPVLAGPIKAIGKRVFGDTNVDAVRSGNWFGNDTTWRMVLDLNRILMYADAAGRWHDRPVRRFWSIVDGIISGEGNGPLDPQPRSCGWVVTGGNPVAVDATCARLMGFRLDRLPMIARAMDAHAFPLTTFGAGEIQVTRELGTTPLESLTSESSFRPHFGWRDYVEDVTLTPCWTACVPESSAGS